MKYRSLVQLVMIAGLFVGACSDKRRSSGNGNGAATPEQQVRAAVADMIRLLESGEHRELIETYANPEEFKKLSPEEFDKLIEGFGGKKSKALLEELEKIDIHSVACKINEDRTEAAFEHERFAKEGMWFRKIDGKWYLRGRRPRPRAEEASPAPMPMPKRPMERPAAQPLTPDTVRPLRDDIDRR